MFAMIASNNLEYSIMTFPCVLPRKSVQNRLENSDLRITISDRFRWWRYASEKMTQYVKIHVIFSKIQTRGVKARLLSKDELLFFPELGEILILVSWHKKSFFVPVSD